MVSSRGSRRPPGRAPVGLEPIAKPGGGFRWLARLDPADERDYRLLVARVTPRIERALGREVVANRVRGRGSLRTVSLEPWGSARRVYRRRLQVLFARDPAAILVADVRDCFGSIDPPATASALAELGSRDDTREIVRLLERFAEDGVPGLPIGPEPSAILANAVLARADRVLSAAGMAHVRWVDDIVGVARDARHAERALSAWRETLASLGLDVHEEKTRILEPVEWLERANTCRPSPPLRLR